MKTPVDFDIYQDSSPQRKWFIDLSVIMLVFFVILMIFEGSIRKWVSPSFGTPLQVLRDILPGMALWSYLASNPLRRTVRRALPSSAVLTVFLGYLFFAVVSILNSGVNSIPVAILGLRTHFFYIPLTFFVPIIIGNTPAVQKLLFRLALLSVPVSILAVYQSTQPQNSWINIYGTGEHAGALFGDEGLVRAAGTFSYITAMGYYAQFSAITSFYLAMSVSNAKVRAISLLALTAAVMAGFSTGSRAIVFGIIVQIIVMIMLCPLLIKIFLKKAAKNWLVFFASAILVIYFGEQQFDAFLQRTQSVSDDTGWRLVDGLLEWVDILERYPFGSGLGSGHQQAAVFAGERGGFGGFNALPESELSRVAMELGIPGFLFFLAFRGLVIYFAFKVTLSTSDLQSRMLASVAFSYLILLIAGGVYSPIANAFYWFSLGIIVMIRIEGRGRY